MAILTNASDTHLYCAADNFVASTSPFSVSVWVNTVWNGNSRVTLCGLYNGTYNGSVTTTTAMQIGTSTGSGELSVWTYGGTQLVDSATGVMTPYNNTWAMITYTYDGTTHSIYNGPTLVGSSTSAPVSGTFTQVYINGYPPTGNANETSASYFDSYSYFNRTLSQPEIQCMYTAAGFRDGIVYGELANYSFGGGAQGATVTELNDLTGNGNNLTYTGTGSAITYTYTNSYPDINLRPPL